jgi:hypothetical protein
LQSISSADVIDPMKPSTLATLALIASAVWAIPSSADWPEARCDGNYPAGIVRMEDCRASATGRRTTRA